MDPPDTESVEGKTADEDSGNLFLAASTVMMVCALAWRRHRLRCSLGPPQLPHQELLEVFRVYLSPTGGFATAHFFLPAVCLLTYGTLHAHSLVGYENFGRQVRSCWYSRERANDSLPLYSPERARCA